MSGLPQRETRVQITVDTGKDKHYARITWPHKKQFLESGNSTRSRKMEKWGS